MKPDHRKAKRDSNWTGPVFSEEFSQNNNHVFESPYEFQCFIEQEVAMDPFIEKPEFVWATKPLPPVRLDFGDIHYLIASCQSTPIEKAVRELEAAVDAFNAAHSRVTFGPDYSTIIPLQWSDPAPKKPVTPPEDE